MKSLGRVVFSKRYQWKERDAFTYWLRKSVSVERVAEFFDCREVTVKRRVQRYRLRTRASR